MKTMGVILTVLAIALAIYTAIYMPLTWFLVFTFSSLLYGFVSPVIASRKLFFLATEAPHASLFSVVMGILIYKLTNVLNEFLWALIISIILINFVGYFIRAGTDPDVATSIVISLTASGSVVATYYVLTMYSVQYNLWSYILGDPLLVTSREAYQLVVITIVVVIATIYLYMISIYMGIDIDYAKLSTKNIWLYDTAFYIILGVSSVALLKIVGFVLEHILLTLPAIIAANIASSAREAMHISVLSSVTSSLLGLLLSIRVNIAPAGAIGFIILLIYIIAKIVSVRRSA
ncbi:metal ABC transporter permease [Ignisphaera sp. 4213-co]|uniref:Metal ABC transporter permease n=1 Tax=Ignisphaera cupida TaxID=3050454 RepID=A0ABD4Z9I6_9CREN|nr:metal ABC transporter permease [Ignisphaera sp. 4213-co]MDK6028945.1 metal ABC transporter permease [Ignisphaera sp. 4213-co]